MNIAILLAGGTGSRMKLNRPKQFVEVKGHPIIEWSLRTLLDHNSISGIVIGVDETWQNYIANLDILRRTNKFVLYSRPGLTRQMTILNALKLIKESGYECKNVLIHDSARPNLSVALIDECLNRIKESDGVLPGLPVKDTIYLLNEGGDITSLLERSKLYAGQAPEIFNYELYLNAHYKLTDLQLMRVNGSSEVAFLAGMRISVIPGDENNYKITTLSDLKQFEKDESTSSLWNQ